MISNNNGYYNYRYLVGGMPWYAYSSEKYEFVSWDDDILNIWKNKIHVPNHQLDIISYYIIFM